MRENRVHVHLGWEEIKVVGLEIRSEQKNEMLIGTMYMYSQLVMFSVK